MAEVFQGTPVLVSVRIDGPEGKSVQYHVAGRDLSDVAEAVRSSLAELPDRAEESKPKKSRKPRRSKQEMLDSKPDSIQEEIADEPKAEKKSKPWHD